ncbi:hypothetical protein ACEPTV_33410, partial [Burkholderia pseudomallei]|uniref:hypothetical protein n=1 Tax=Burkholderia pseudomallei TaxID=28450 RepID=UPI00358FB526
MPEIKPSQFDRHGRHWQTHGTQVQPLDAVGLPIRDRLVVHSQFDPKLHKRPVVASTVNGPIGSCELRMLPDDARSYARALLQAADLA